MHRMISSAAMRCLRRTNDSAHSESAPDGYGNNFPARGRPRCFSGPGAFQMRWRGVKVMSEFATAGRIPVRQKTASPRLRPPPQLPLAASP